MADEGKASVEIVGDVRDFARKTEAELNKALAKIKPDPIRLVFDGDHLRIEAQQTGEAVGAAVVDGAETEIDSSRGKLSAAGSGAGDAIGDGVQRGMLGKLQDSFTSLIRMSRDSGGRAGGEAGKSFGKRFGDGADSSGGFGRGLFSKIGPTLKKGFEGLTSMLGPVLGTVGKGVAISFGVAFAATAAGVIGPALGAAITTALGVGLGAAFIGLGALALREAKPLKEAFKDVGKTLDTVGRQAAKPLLKPLTQALRDTSELIRQLKPEWTSIFKQLAPAIKPLNQAFGEFLGSLSRGFKDSVPGINAALKGFGDGLVTVGKSLGDFFRTIFSNEGLIDNAAEGIMNLINLAIRPLGSMISGLTVIFAAWNNFLKLSSGTYLPMITEALFNFVDGGTGAIGRIKDAWGPLGDAIQNVWDKIKAFAGEDNAGALQARFAAVIEAIKAAWAPLKEFIGVLWQEIVAFLQRVWNEQFIPWWEGTARPWLESAMRTAFGAALDAARSVAVQRLSALVNDFQRWVGQIPVRVRGGLAALPGIFASAFATATSRVLSGAMQLVNGAISVIRQLPSRIGSTLAGVRNAVTGAFAGAGGWLASAGASIINGLISGIRAGFDRVRSTLGSLTSMLPDWKGPAAVDRKILYQSGQMVMQGFERAILDSRRSIANTLGGVTGDLAGMATGGRGYGSTTTVSGGLTFNINVSGATGEQAGRRAAEQVLAQLAAAGLVR